MGQENTEQKMVSRVTSEETAQNCHCSSLANWSQHTRCASAAVFACQVYRSQVEPWSLIGQMAVT